MGFNRRQSCAKLFLDEIVSKCAMIVAIPPAVVNGLATYFSYFLFLMSGVAFEVGVGKWKSGLISL
jgi:hypothetical protein